MPQNPLILSKIGSPQRKKARYSDEKPSGSTTARIIHARPPRSQEARQRRQQAIAAALSQADNKPEPLASARASSPARTTREDSPAIAVVAKALTPKRKLPPSPSKRKENVSPRTGTIVSPAASPRKAHPDLGEVFPTSDLNITDLEDEDEDFSAPIPRPLFGAPLISMDSLSTAFMRPDFRPPPLSASSLGQSASRSPSPTPQLPASQISTIPGGVFMSARMNKIEVSAEALARASRVIEQVDQENFDDDDDPEVLLSLVRMKTSLQSKGVNARKGLLPFKSPLVRPPPSASRQQQHQLRTSTSFQLSKPMAQTSTPIRFSTPTPAGFASSSTSAVTSTPVRRHLLSSQAPQTQFSAASKPFSSPLVNSNSQRPASVSSSSKPLPRLGTGNTPGTSRFKTFQTPFKPGFGPGGLSKPLSTPSPSRVSTASQMGVTFGANRPLVPSSLSELTSTADSPQPTSVPPLSEDKEEVPRSLDKGKEKEIAELPKPVPVVKRGVLPDNAVFDLR